MDRNQVFTNKSRLKGKDMSYTESVTKIKVSALNEGRRKDNVKYQSQYEGQTFF